MMLEKKLTRSTAEAAAEVLGLEAIGIDAITVDEVKTAYRNALKNSHPDTSALKAGDRYSINGGPVLEATDAQAGDLIFAARKAKELLQEWIEMRPDSACSICRGSGYIRGSGFSSRECPRCMRGVKR